MKRLFLLALIAMAANAADLTYTETTQLTGGSMKSMVGFAARLGGTNLGKGVTSTVVVSGNKQASRSGDESTVIDVDKGTMTTIDYKAKKYSTITFEEMVAAYEQMPQAMADAQAKQPKSDVKADTKVKVTSKATGAGPEIAGTSTKLVEVIVESTTTVKDEKKGDTATITSTMRTEQAMGTPQGWQAIRDFYRRMAAKMPLRPDAATQMMRQSGLTVEAMDEAGKKLATLDGMSMRSVMQMIGSGPAGPQVDMPSGKDIARGALSGLPGFGRKKQEPAKEEAKAAPAGPNILLEFTTEVKSIQPGVADAQAFVVPAGFKEQEHPMKRLAREKK
ncbi:MAG: hypothetical protein ABI824_16665 [Acidobacteriota bacterium]